jgi:hypothetical protein
VAKKSCLGDLGSPVVYAIEGTARGNYFEQHFVLSSGFDCKLPAMAFTQVSNRQILNWIRNVTGKPFFPCLSLAKLKSVFWYQISILNSQQGFSFIFTELTS